MAGVLGSVYGSFRYTKEIHEASLGPIELSVKDKETVTIPIWTVVGSIAIGGALLLFGSKKRLTKSSATALLLYLLTWSIFLSAPESFSHRRSDIR